MIITRKSQVLINFLDLRVVVNEKQIYPLLTEQPVLVLLSAPEATLVVSDGFHITHRLQVSCRRAQACRLHVVCRIDDNLFYTVLLLTALLILLGLLSGILFSKLLSVLPLLYLLYWFYLRRADFLQVKMISR